MEEEAKKFYRSKTFWVNIIAAAAILAQTQTGFVIGAESQAAILAVINLVLRAVTKQPIAWKDEGNRELDN